MKKLTLKQLEFRKEEAARIARSAREEADRADYALQRATLENLKRRRKNGSTNAKGIVGSHRRA